MTLVNSKEIPIAAWRIYALKKKGIFEFAQPILAVERRPYKSSSEKGGSKGIASLKIDHRTGNRG